MRMLGVGFAGWLNFLFIKNHDDQTNQTITKNAFNQPNVIPADGAHYKKVQLSQPYSDTLVLKSWNTYELREGNDQWMMRAIPGCDDDIDWPVREGLNKKLFSMASKAIETNHRMNKK